MPCIYVIASHDTDIDETIWGAWRAFASFLDAECKCMLEFDKLPVFFTRVTFEFCIEDYQTTKPEVGNVRDCNAVTV